MIGLIDVNSGNLGSLISALEKIDVKFKICKNKQDLDGLSKILLPGVGSYPNFIKNLKKQCLFSKIKEKVDLKETSIFGICVGFQALFESSDELELTEGLGLIKGKVSKLSNSLVLPHIGWNSCKNFTNSRLFKNIEVGSDFYFCHSYVVKKVSDKIEITETEYGEKFISSVEYENIFGVQFHPEKSQINGLSVLQNFCKL